MTDRTTRRSLISSLGLVAVTGCTSSEGVKEELKIEVGESELLETVEFAAGGQRRYDILNAVVTERAYSADRLNIVATDGSLISSMELKTGVRRYSFEFYSDQGPQTNFVFVEDDQILETVRVKISGVQ